MGKFPEGFVASCVASINCTSLRVLVNCDKLLCANGSHPKLKSFFPRVLGQFFLRFSLRGKYGHEHWWNDFPFHLFPINMT
jgi:hypothetical protein